MHNRWCIVSGPRTGSTWLERMIYQYWKSIDDNAIRCDELCDIDIGTKFPVELNNLGYLVKTENPIDCKSVRNLMERNLEYFKKANKNQPIVLKLFVQLLKANKDDYIFFLTELEKLGFKFINLNRILFDKSLSYYFMMTTKIVHRYTENNITFYSTTNSTNTNEVSTDKLEIDFYYFEGWYRMMEKDVQAQNEICEMFRSKTIPINYETLLEDCLIEQVPHKFVNVIKTYEENYKEKIEEKSWERLITEYKKNNIKNTACKFAWDYSVLNLNRNEIRNCCRAKARKISDYDFRKGKELFSHAVTITKVKKELLHGIQTKDCESCWQIENNDGISQRSGLKNFVDYVKTNLYKDLSKSQITEKLNHLSIDEIDKICNIKDTRMIELSLGNTCDLKCVYCSHHYSSQWAAEKLRYKEIPLESIQDELPKVGFDTEFEKHFWEWFEKESYSQIEFINFIGGEPLIIDKFYSYTDKILDWYEINPQSQYPRINIGLVTNFNTPAKFYDKFIDFNLKIIGSEKVHLDFNLSLESLGNRTEFIRTNTNWNTLLNNFQNYLEFLSIVVPEELEHFPKVSVSLQVALNTLSISNLPDFLRFVIELQKKYNRRIGLRQNQVVYPNWCNPHILTSDYADYIDEAIDVCKSMDQFPLIDYPEFGKWDRYVDFLYNLKSLILNENKDIMARQSFVENIDKLSLRRNLNFHNTFPEMIDFYNLCKET